PSLTDVLPNIPNPISPLKAVSADHLVFDLWIDSFAAGANYVNQLSNAGLEKVWVINHDWQNGGYDNKLPDVLPANPARGGEAGLQQLSNVAADAGYLFGLHENYIDFYPNAPSWDDLDISLNSDGSLKTAWFNSTTGMQSFQMKPSRAAFYLTSFSPEIHSQYATTASFLDVHSAISPSSVVDYDDTVPSWGSFREALQLYRELPGKLRQAHDGPISGEGNNHFLSMGYYDDIEAQINIGGYGDRSQGQWLPLLVDFDLYKMHHLGAVHGVGYYERFFCAESGESAYKTFSLGFSKKYIATELAYGHGGFIPSPYRLEDFITAAKLEAKHVQPAQRLYANALVKAITYHDQGRQVDASEYIRTHPTTFNNIDHADFMGQVRVEYDNGVIVCVNRHPTREWSVHIESIGGSYNVHAVINGEAVIEVGHFSQSDFILPPAAGWLVYTPDASAVEETAVSDKRPQSVQLRQNYPNPFNSSTTIEFALPQQAMVKLQIFNMSGQLVETLINQNVQAGINRCRWEAAHHAGGVYFYRLTAGDRVVTRKLLLLR
ncbi:MAG: T9SS C-terminal target domain-containing protein, partial [Calditrichaeota bacterium]